MEKKDNDYSARITWAFSLIKETKIFFKEFNESIKNFSDYFLNLLNPTLSLQDRDISRMLFSSSPDTERRISALANQCVNIKKDALQFVINDREFKQTAIHWGYNKTKGDKKNV